MKRIIGRFQNIDNWTVFYLLVAITLFSLGFSGFSHWMNGEIAWWAWLDGATQNFSTEMMGAIMTFALFELVVGGRKEREAKEDAVEAEKKRLIIQMRSSDNATALNALQQMLARDWLRDGSLQGADLWKANLKGANFWAANLQEALLGHSNLQEANLLQANLQKANLGDANLQKANLRNANLQEADLEGCNLRWAKLDNTEFDEKTHLSDGLYWTPETDMSRYTDPNHPDFWEPIWVKEQREKDEE